MSGLDLSKLKKISQDKSSAMFAHPDGHEVKIAIMGLSPAMRKKLSEMPVHKSGEDKNPANAEVTSPDDDSTPDLTGNSGPAAPAMPAPTSAPETEPDDDSMPDLTGNSGTAAPIMANGQPAPAQAPLPGSGIAPDDTIVVTGQRTPEQAAAVKTQDNLNFAQDLSSGQIKPETYHSLYEKKDTLGKIGSIFGMMLSGAGSGLAHQPNAMLELMNRQISNDLEAQKANQSNKISWYSYALQHEKQQPEIAKEWAQAQSTGSKADFDRWMNNKMGIIDQSATNDAHNYMSIGAVSNIQDMINRMPPSPARDRMQAQHDNVLLPGVVAQAQKSNLEMERKKTLMNAANPLPEPADEETSKKAGPVALGTRMPAIDQDKLSKGTLLGKKLGEEKAGLVDGAIPPSQAAKISEELKILQPNRDTYADATGSFNHLANMPKAGQAPEIEAGSSLMGAAANLIPFTKGASANGIGDKLQSAFEQERNTQIEGLVGKMARGQLTPDSARVLVNSWMPSWIDTPKQRELKFEQMKNHFTSAPEENAQTAKTYGVFNEMPDYQFHAPREKKVKSDMKRPTGGMAGQE